MLLKVNKQDICRNFEFEKGKVGIAIKNKVKQETSHAAQPIRNAELCNYNGPACNC